MRRLMPRHHPTIWRQRNKFHVQSKSVSQVNQENPNRIKESPQSNPKKTVIKSKKQQQVRLLKESPYRERKQKTVMSPMPMQNCL